MFRLNEKLAADTCEIDRWALSYVLLANNAHFPWLILVPARDNIREIYELSSDDQSQLMQEINLGSRILANMASPHKLNVAAIGNIVAQLHVHVVARFTTDIAWPKPVWGFPDTRPYSPDAIRTFKDNFFQVKRQIGS